MPNITPRLLRTEWQETIAIFIQETKRTRIMGGVLFRSKSPNVQKLKQRPTKTEISRSKMWKAAMPRRMMMPTAPYQKPDPKRYPKSDSLTMYCILNVLKSNTKELPKHDDRLQYKKVGTIQRTICPGNCVLAASTLSVERHNCFSQCLGQALRTLFLNTQKKLQIRKWAWCVATHQARSKAA